MLAYSEASLNTYFKKTYNKKPNKTTKQQTKTQPEFISFQS